MIKPPASSSTWIGRKKVSPLALLHTSNSMKPKLLNSSRPAGFKVESVKDSPPYHYLITAEPVK